jgi:hypothetical protein
MAQQHMIERVAQVTLDVETPHAVELPTYESTIPAENIRSG